MKAMIIADLMMPIGTLVQQLLIALFIGACICIGMENIYALPPVIIISLCYSRAFTMIALDEQNGWQRYRAVMPASRAQIMSARCISLLVILLVSCVFSLAVCVLAVWVLPPVMHAIGFAGFSLAFDLPSDGPLALLSVALGCLFTVVLLAVTLPLCAKFGMTKSIGLLPLALTVIMIGCFLVLGEADEQIFAALEHLVMDDSAVLIAGAFAASLAVYGIGSAASIALYRRRQF